MNLKDKYVHLAIWLALASNIMYWGILFVNLKADMEPRRTMASFCYAILQTSIYFFIHKIKDSQYFSTYLVASVVTNLLVILFLSSGDLISFAFFVAYSLPALWGLFHGLCVSGIVIYRRLLKQESDEKTTRKVKFWYVLYIVLLVAFLIKDFVDFRTL